MHIQKTLIAADKNIGFSSEYTTFIVDFGNPLCLDHVGFPPRYNTVFEHPYRSCPNSNDIQNFMRVIDV